MNKNKNFRKKWMQTPEQGSNPRKCASLILRILVACAALGLVFWNQDWSKLQAVFRGLDYRYFLLSLGVYAVCQALLALRWWLLLRAQSIHLRIRTTVHLHFVGLFYNNIMPSSIGGDFLRAWYVTKHTHKRIEAALSVFVDRAVGLLSILVMALFSYALFMKGMAPLQAGTATLSTEDPKTPINLLITVVIAGGILLVGLLICRRSRQFLIKQWGRIKTMIRTMLAKLQEALLIYWKQPLVLIQTLGLTLFLQSCTIMTFYLLGRNLGIDATAKHYFVIFPLMWVVGAIPITPAGLGILEGGIVFLFIHYTQATQEQATCLALCQRFIWILSSLPGAAIHMFGSHLPKNAVAAFSFDDLENGD
jgi:glycosyltransferase 2 family protein